MAINEASKETDFSSRHGRQESSGSLCIRPVILDICARYGGVRILCVRCGNRKPGNVRQDAGCAVEMECGGNGTANPVQWTLADGFGQKKPVGSLQAEENDVDIVVHTEIDDLHLQASTLIELSSQRLRPNGILMIVLPVHGGWETLWHIAWTWWDHPSSRQAQFWSRQRLSALIESQGFKILESIKIKKSSTQREAIVLVARKIVPSGTASTAKRVSVG